MSAMLVGLLAFLLLPLSAWAEAPTVLTIRPEKIDPGGDGRQSGLEPARDPFNWGKEQLNQLKTKAPKVKNNAMDGLVLSGIIWDESQPLAVINNLMVARGEMINELLVVDIGKDSVIIEQNGIRHALSLDSPLKILPARKKK